MQNHACPCLLKASGFDPSFTDADADAAILVDAASPKEGCASKTRAQKKNPQPALGSSGHGLVCPFLSRSLPAAAGTSSPRKKDRAGQGQRYMIWLEVETPLATGLLLIQPLLLQ